jgi:hypothetical protein
MGVPKCVVAHEIEVRAALIGRLHRAEGNFERRLAPTYPGDDAGGEIVVDECLDEEFVGAGESALRKILDAGRFARKSQVLLVPKNLTARVPEILAGFRNERSGDQRPKYSYWR